MDARLTISNLISKHSKIKGHVLELCNKSINHRHTDSEEIARMNTKIARWTNDMESALESSATNSARAIDTHRLVLSILREETIISLNRPQLTAQRESAVYEGALQTCIASSRSIIRTLASHTKVANAAPLTWPSLTWATWMSAFIVLYAAVENELSVTVALS